VVFGNELISHTVRFSNYKSLKNSKLDAAPLHSEMEHLITVLFDLEFQTRFYTNTYLLCRRGVGRIPFRRCFHFHLAARKEQINNAACL
jgi:hypothetical protein